MKADDPSAFGEAVRREIERDLVVEREGWAADLVARASSQISAVDTGPPLEVSVLWITRPLAFTLPGRQIYISRELLSRGLPERAVAFVIGHEIGHHRAGHFDRFNDWAGKIPGRLGLNIALIAHAADAMVSSSPRREQAADRIAFELCRQAGYPDDAGVVAMKLIERIQLDYGNIRGVFGTSGTTHPPTRLRRETLEAWANEDVRSPSDLFADYVTWKRHLESPD